MPPPTHPRASGGGLPRRLRALLAWRELLFGIFAGVGRQLARGRGHAVNRLPDRDIEVGMREFRRVLAALDDEIAAERRRFPSGSDS